MQAVLAQRDEDLKTVAADKSKLELEAEGFAQRLKRLDDSEQRYKDENWNLETQLQDIQASGREAASREHKMQQALMTTTSEKNAAQQELDEIKQKHGRVTEDFAYLRKTHESALADLRKEVNLGENEKNTLQRKIEELLSQNQELATGLHNRLKAEAANPQNNVAALSEDDAFYISDPEPSPPPSPTKGGQRHSMLESETLKSSLNHAHKMIQNLKGNVNREKTEKLELKRMLQEARDELEARRAEPSEKRHKTRAQQDTKTQRAGLGAVRSGKTDILMDDPENDPEWEDAGDNLARKFNASNSRRASPVVPLVPKPVTDSSDAYQTATETEDAFETANERDTTDNDAFQTGAESLADESSDDLTETEGVGRRGTSRGRNPLVPTKAGNRASIQSTASTSEDEDDQAIHTPIQGQTQRFRLRMSRSSRRSRVISALLDSNPSTTKNSPASFTNGGAEPGQSLAAELENLSGDEEGTPSKGGISTPRSSLSTRRILHDKRSSSSLRRPVDSQPSTPGIRVGSAIYTGAPPVPRVPMVDTGVMTEPWEPVQVSKEQNELNSAPSSILPAAAAASITSRIFGTSPSTPQNKGQLSEPASGSNLGSSTSTSTSTPPQPVWDQSIPSAKAFAVNDSVDSTPLSTRSATSQIQGPVEGSSAVRDPEGVSSDSTPEATATPKVQNVQPKLSVSAISSLETVPVDPIIKTPSSTAPGVSTNASSDQTPTKSPTGILGSVLGWRKSTSASAPQIAEDETSQEVSPPAANNSKDGKAPLQEVSTNTINKQPYAKAINIAEEEVIPTIKADQSSQTVLSSAQIESMLNAKVAKPDIVTDKPTLAHPVKPLADIGPVTTSTPAHQGKLPEVRIPEGSNSGSSRDIGGRVIVKRPSSTTSLRSRTAQYPPLPPDHQEAIAAATQRDSASSVMGPPMAPASAYPLRSMRSRAGSRPQTPSQQGYASPSSKGGTTPRAGRYSNTRSLTSRRSSVSSFASELDERFNIRAEGFIPHGYQGATDPRMIQAITQTMIGERMWKYTRKAGRGEMSNTRHPRFFWVHPYTRTLYWSDRDPATANRAELKSKSVAIEAVRVVTDDNPMPPGLHRKSLIVVTPGRSVKFTAQTSQRHETWFNALSYLLLRTGQEEDGNEGENADLTEADVQEFNPMNAQDRRTPRTRVSVGSFRSQSTANRTAQASLTSRVPANSLANRLVQHPQTVPESGVVEEERGLSIRKRVSRSLSRTRGRSSGRGVEERASSSNLAAANNEMNPDNLNRTSNYNKPSHSSISSRISSYWKTADTANGNRSSVRSRSSVQPEAVVEPGVLEGGRSVVSVNGANDSAEDLRRVIEEREDKGNLENVRACCDGTFSR